MRYAHVIGNTVIGVYEFTGTVNRPDYIESTDAQIGWLLEGDQLIPPPAPAEPVRVVITGLAINGTQQITPRSRVVLRAGQSLGVVAETRQGGQLVPVTDSFAVPIGRVNGAVETTERAEFIGGIANMLIPFPSAGEFEVTQALLNLYLPPERQMLFDTFNISVTRT